MKSSERWVKLLSYGPCLALIGSLLIGSPQGLAQNAESSATEPLRLTVAPHTSSRIAMKTLPKATCLLHVDGDNDTSRSFKLFSDDDGMIRFNVNPREQSEEVAAFAVDCTADIQSRTFRLELRPSGTPDFDMPAPAPDIRAPRASDVMRPALTKQEALRLSQEELIQREYPVRPNPEQAPEAFADWLHAVTQPARRVNPRQVAHSDITASNWELLNNWSGFELRNPTCDPCGIYDLVMGEWYVPTVSISDNDTQTVSAFWIGLDGDGPAYSDLWQAGTDQAIRNYTWGPFSLDVSSYFAWNELLPRQSTSQVLTNINVSAGDLMFSEIWVGNMGQSPALSYPSGPPLFAISYVEDISNGGYEWTYNCLGVYVGSTCTSQGQNAILGMEAEWIMERPMIGGVGGPLYDLADYREATMYDAYAMQTNGTLVNYNGANNQYIWMYNSSTGHLLSLPEVYNNSTIQYFWYNWY